jgi:putative choline sulfate-utilization transcription factor
MTPLFRRLPSLSSLPYFEAASRLGSFSAAARELNSSQPAVSHHIARLEAELGTPLFVRGYRGAVPTAAGAHLLEAVQRGMTGIAEAVATLRQRHPDEALTIATDFGLAAFWLMPRLDELRRALAETDVRILTSQRPVDVAAEPVDLAIAFGGGRWRGCSAEKLFDEVAIPVCSPSFLARCGPLRTLHRFRELPLLHLAAPEPGQWLGWDDILPACAAPGSAERSLTFNDYALVLQAAMAGQGVALGWRPLVNRLLDAGTLVVALDHEVRTSRGYFIVSPMRQRGQTRLARLRRWLIDEASRGA